MEKAQARGVETLARQTQHGLLIAVHGVPQNGMADISQMDPDLVGTARLQSAAQVGDTGIPGQHLPMGDGGTSLGHHRHLLAVAAAAADRGVYGAAVLPEVPHRQTLIGTGQRMIRQLGRQCQMGGVVFGGDDQAAGVPVDAVDDAGTLLAADAGEGVPAMVQQGVDQRAVRVARRRMHHHAHGLIHHDDVLILVDHVQRDILRDGLRLLCLRQRHAQLLPTGDAVAFAGDGAITGDAALRQQSCGGGAGQALHSPGQEAVQPGAGILLKRGQTDRVHGQTPSFSCRTCRRGTGSTPRPEWLPPPRSSPPD